MSRTTILPKCAIAFVGVLTAFSIGFGEVVVCPKCGHEIEQGRDACGHCQARVVSSEETPDVAPELPGAVSDDEFDVSGKLQFLGLRTVAGELKLGKKYMVGKDPDMARCLFRNALAMERLTRQDDDGKRGKIIKKLIAGTCTPGDLVRQVCFVCEGNRKSVVTFGTLSGETISKERGGLTCPRCRNGRYITKRITIAQWKDAEKRAGKRFSLVQQARGFSAVGNAWIPEKLAGKLTVQQKAALIQGIAVGCEECDGIGQVDCRKCDGLGEVPCKAKGCQLGMVTLKSDGRLMKATTIRTEKCGECAGKGCAPCAECHGTGRTECGKCKGSGLKEECTKCDGVGVSDCRRCKGEGTYKDSPCPVCKGEKQVLCPTCKGEGRKR